jgi:hypothetical protein
MTPVAEPPADIARVQEPALQVSRTRKVVRFLFPVLAVLALTGLRMFTAERARISEAAARSASRTALGFTVTHEAGRLLLSWNASAESVQTAQRATLSIRDGKRSEDVDLYLPTFRTGSMFYLPETDDVSFLLTVVSAKRPGELAESVRVLGALRDLEPRRLVQQVEASPDRSQPEETSVVRASVTRPTSMSEMPKTPALDSRSSSPTETPSAAPAETAAAQ